MNCRYETVHPIADCGLQIVDLRDGARLIQGSQMVEFRGPHPSVSRTHF
jgi:hypothetical protein